MPLSDLYGLVLSGGKSSRMGTDKGLLKYYGVPHREYLFELLKKHCEKVYTSCHRGQQISENLNPLIDQFDLDSPINGILTAFQTHPTKAWLIVAVDMPYVTEDTLKLLIAGRDTAKVATCFYNAGEMLPEPLLTLWETSAYPLLLAFVEKGKVSPRDFLNSNQIQMVNPPDDKTLMNVNAPGEIPF